MATLEVLLLACVLAFLTIILVRMDRSYRARRSNDQPTTKKKATK